MCRKAEGLLIYVFYNDTLIPGFINNTTVQAEK